MGYIDIMIIVLVVSIIMMLIGIPIAYVLGFCTAVGIMVTVGSGTLTQMGVTPYSTFHKLDFTPLPLF